MYPFYIFVVLAMSADGKIADAHRSAARFGSIADRRQLETRIAAADAVLFGGGTLRAYGTTLGIRQPSLLERRRRQGRPPQPLQVVVSPSAQISPALRFFQQPLPRALLTTPAGAQRWGQQPGFDYLWPVLSAQPVDWRQALAPLRHLGCQRLALLGGGQLVAAFLAQNLVDELYLTLCPLLLGGQAAPTPVDGEGWLAAAAPRLRLISSRVLDQEVYLHYRVQRSTLESPLQPPQNSITLEQTIQTP